VQLLSQQIGFLKYLSIFCYTITFLDIFILFVKEIKLVPYSLEFVVKISLKSRIFIHKMVIALGNTVPFNET
jgi:hypothetical protein